MAELLNCTEAAAAFNIPYTLVTELCRSGRFRSAHKGKPVDGGQSCWQLEPADLERFLRENPRRHTGTNRPEPWSPRYRPARDGGPTELQYEVLARESWHRLLDMRLRENGDLWTRWSDGERFIIRPDGEMDQFRYERIGFKYREQERERHASYAD